MEEVKYKGHSKTQPINCLECDKVFAAKIVEVKRGHAKFCSISCSATHFNKQRPIIDPNCNCSNCDKMFYRKPHLVNKSENKIFFCNRDCQSDWRRTHQWANSSKRPSSWQRLTVAIKAERGNKCEECGWAEANCDVAHIIPRSQGGPDTRENALVLCPNHHRVLDKKSKISTVKSVVE